MVAIEETTETESSSSAPLVSRLTTSFVSCGVPLSCILLAPEMVDLFMMSALNEIDSVGYGPNRGIDQHLENKSKWQSRATKDRAAEETKEVTVCSSKFGTMASTTTERGNAMVYHELMVEAFSIRSNYF